MIHGTLMDKTLRASVCWALVVSTVFTLAMVETGGSPDLTGEKTQTLQEVKTVLSSRHPALPRPHVVSMLNEIMAGRGTVTAQNLLLERKNTVSSFLQFPKCKNTEWCLSSVRFGVNRLYSPL